MPPPRLLPALAALLVSTLALGAGACHGQGDPLPGCFEWAVLTYPEGDALEDVSQALQAEGQTCTPDGEEGEEHLVCSPYDDEASCEAARTGLIEALDEQGLHAEISCVCTAQS